MADALIALGLIVGGLVGIAAGAIVTWRAQRQRRELEKALASARFAQEQIANAPMSESPSLTASGTPALPKRLVQACAQGECVLFISRGMAGQAGLPTRFELLSQLLKQLEGKVDGAEYTTLQALMRERPSLVAEMIAARLSPQELFEQVQNLHGRRSRSVPEAFQLVGDLPLAGVLTESWDDILEEATSGWPTLYVTDSDRLAQLVRDQQPWVLKLWGDLQRPDRFVFTAEQFVTALYDNPLLSRTLSTIVNSKTILFAGASLESIESFLASLPLRHEGAEPSHFALVPTGFDFEVQKEQFARKYGVELLAYTPTAGYPEVPAFLRNLRNAVAPGVSPGSATAKPGPMKLEGVELHNIGPFSDLSLQLGGGWTVLLGNNGCGKSTVLQAIALALAGDDPIGAEVGGRVLRTGAEKGEIKLRIGGSSYRTDLIRERDGVRVVPHGPTPLQAGTLAALGFPPLRGISTRNPRGPSQDGSPQPSVRDVRALIAEVIDDRMDDLKQWAVNVELRAEGGSGLDRSVARRAGRLREAFFEVLNDMTPGLTLEYKGIDRSTWDLLVRTDDGLVPIDLVSQGTSSLLGWVGIVLQRLYEIYGDVEDPKAEHALVLVDEIDAHMHPEWQQQVIALVEEHFPNLQVVATTHSPLVVGNVGEGRNIVRFHRQDGHKLTVEQMDYSFRGWYADQILTSTAFGLETTLDTQTQSKLAEYTQLLGKSKRAPLEEERFESLTRQIESTIPLAPERAEAREAKQLVEEWAADRFRQRPEEERRRVMAEVDSYLDKIAPEPDEEAR